MEDSNDNEKNILDRNILLDMEEQRQNLQLKSAAISLTAYKDLKIEREKNIQLFFEEKEKDSIFEETKLEFEILNKKIERRDAVIKNLKMNIVANRILGKHGDDVELRVKANALSLEEQVGDYLLIYSYTYLWMAVW